jgi:hypothetical protein
MLRVTDCVLECVRFAVQKPTEWQRIGNQIDTVMILKGGGLRKRAWNAQPLA